MHRVAQHAACPCHSCRGAGLPRVAATRGLATPVDLPSPEKEYAFEIAASNLRFGHGVTKEIGMDFANLKATKARPTANWQ